MDADARSYHYGEPDAGDLRHHDYLIPAVLSILKDARPKRILDLGCGNGLATHVLATHGYRIIGVDPSEEGISWALAHYPDIEVHQGSANDDLRGRFGTFPVVISLEVVEHIYDPRTYARTLFSLIEPGGLAIVSTPYNGYLKNLVVALFNKFDAHHNPLWDHGHIKFWSVATLTRLLEEAGFDAIEFRRVGRIPPVAKSMIAIAKKRSEV
jgi:2-polyprenyl-3-methyl-5-hydroxy-6-metoxy-1,4-benzoquinol methylase